MTIMDKTTTNKTHQKNTILDAALAYHQQGLRVVILHNLTVTNGCSCQLGQECLHQGKHPRKGGWNKPGAGMLETPDDIRDAFTRHPRANVGIITGGSQYSNIICIDVDPKHGGEQSLASLLASNSQFPPTWQARTGSGGSHFLFKHPGPGWIVRNSQADDKKHHPKLGTGLDVKGDRGQFVAPPSAHASGKRYEWVNPPGGDVPLADLPDWLRALIAEPKESKHTRRRNGYVDQVAATKRIEVWAKKALQAECDRVLNAPAGTGNDTLNQASFNIGQIVAGGGLNEDEAVAALLDAATAGNRRPEFEAAKTIHSGISSGKSQPRTPPEEITKAPARFHISSHSQNNSQSTSTQQPASSQPAPEIDEHSDDPHRLARMFIERHGSYEGKQRFWKWRDEWYVWNAKLKAYRELPKDELKDQLCRFIKQEFDVVAEEDGKKPLRVTAQTISNTYAALGSLTLLPTSRVDSMPSWLGHTSLSSHSTLSQQSLLTVQNGILDLTKLETAATAEDVLLPHTPEWFSLTSLPITFDPGATCPKWMEFLSRNLEDDQQRINLLQEWFGYCLTPDTSLQKFLLMVGEGANGKSVICAVLYALLGVQNISPVPLELFGERFQLTTTLGKLANVAAEVGELDKAAEGHLKAFTSGDFMLFDRKGKRPIMTRPTARLVLATNNLPRFSDKSGGLWRRILFLPLNISIPENERVPGMDRFEWWRDQNELPGILNWALVGYSRLQQQRRFTHSEVSHAGLEEYKTEANPVRAFFEEEIVVSEGSWTSSTAIYEAYSTWCKRSGYHAMSKVTFFREVNRNCTRCTTWGTVERRQDYDGVKRVWGYRNLSVNNVSNA